MASTKNSKRRMSFSDIKMLVQLKTFYVVFLLLLGGVALLCFAYSPLSKGSVLEVLCSSLGITLITSASVSFLMEVFLRLDIVDFTSERLMAVMPKDIKNNSGIKEFCSDRKELDFRSLWRESSGFLKIIGISSNDILSPANLPLLKKKLESDKSIIVQVLLLSPWSLAAKLRSEANAYRTRTECLSRIYSVIIDIENYLKTIEECGIDTNRVQLRLYDTVPSLSMIIDENSAVVAPIMDVEQGGSSPYFVAENIETSNCIYNVYISHFDSVWNSAFPVDLNDDQSLSLSFAAQKQKDMSRLDSIPQDFSQWIVDINTVHN